MRPPAAREEIPPGTLDMLILRTLARHGELHGFQIAESIREGSANVLRVEEGSLYPALQRMLIKGWLNDEWSRTEGNRRARYYRLTATGRRQLQREMTAYERVHLAIARILQPVSATS
jgi:PadR family transcriptional regulator, regulatory protein PadR